MDVQFILDTDASDNELGAVLSQVPGGQEHMIAFTVCALSKPERNYSTNQTSCWPLCGGSEHFET